MNKTIKKSIFLFFLIIFIPSCSYLKKDKDDKEESLQKKKVISANIDEKIANQGGIILGGKKDDNGFQFATSNVLWRASLEALSEIPLSNVDYSGGVIVTDWYSNEKSNESIKITVNFVSSKLSPSSIKIKSFKKKCDSQANCRTVKLGEGFNKKIKEKIINQAKDLEIKRKK